MESLIGIFLEIWHLLAEMAPYLLFGFLIAGILHAYLPPDLISRHLSGNHLSSVLKASIFGVPLPLCSCGVLPVAAHLRQQGARKGSVLSFLISTPTTGVDSILATYALLGPLLAVMRPIASLVSGVIGGITANTLIKEEDFPGKAWNPSSRHPVSKQHRHMQKLRSAFHYGFVELVADIAKWLAIGIISGGLLTWFLPDNALSEWLATPWIAYSAMLIAGIPMYVCATGSIPIVAALMLKGLSPGAAFIFLFAGPATNTAAIAFVGGKLGRRALFTYLGTIFLCGLGFGLLIDMMWTDAAELAFRSGHMHTLLPAWVNQLSALILLALLTVTGLRAVHRSAPAVEADADENGAVSFSVPNMTCEHCKTTITHALENTEGVAAVRVDLNNKIVRVGGTSPAAKIKSAIESAGYEVTD